METDKKKRSLVPFFIGVALLLLVATPTCIKKVGQLANNLGNNLSGPKTYGTGVLEIKPGEVYVVNTDGQSFTCYPFGPHEFSLDGIKGKGNGHYMINLGNSTSKESLWTRDDPGGLEFPWRYWEVSTVRLRLPSGITKPTRLKIKCRVAPVLEKP
jgi:hypothetical protein